MGAVRTVDYPIGHFLYKAWTISTAATGFTLPYGTKEIMWYGNKVVYLQLGPVLKGLFFTQDAGASYTDYTAYARQMGTTHEVILNSMNTLANGDWLTAIFSHKAAGVYVDVHDVNGTDVALAGYYDAGGSWVSASITDGTDSSACFAQDGVISWTPAAAWRPGTYTFTVGGKDVAVNGYAMRFEVDGAMDSDVNLYRVVPLSDTTTYPGAYLQASTSYVFSVDPEKTGSVHATKVTDDCTAYLTLISSEVE